MRRKPVPSAPAAPLAYSYLRFSSPQQAEGDSLRRQQELRDAWIARAGAVLDTSISLRDEGVSAFTGTHRDNPDRHALAAFLELVKRGRVPRDSYLVVESLDRLSREHIRPALTLLLNLIDAGVRIVQLLPVEAVYDDKVEPMQLLMAIMELARGHSESKLKSERVGRAWGEKKKLAAADGTPMTRRAPSWLKVEDGAFVVDKAKAAAVRRIFDMAAAGYGVGVITKRLNAEGVPPIGRADYWARSYVVKLLTGRAVVGECQPHTRRAGPRRPEGKPIADYFPAIITEDRWHAVQAAIASRKLKGGRPTNRLNLFQGLWHDARDGNSLHVVDKKKKSSGPAIYNYKAGLGVPGAKSIGFPLAVFEDAVLSRLREIDPRDILPRGSNDAADRVSVLAGRLAEVEGRIDKVKAQLVEGGDVESIVGVLRTLDTKRTAAADQLAAAHREAASPLASAWGECRTLLDALQAAPDPLDARTRLRASLRRIVQGIWCLFVVRGQYRLAAVQVWFAGGAHRDFLIIHRRGWADGRAEAKRQAQSWVRSFASAGNADDFDLRKRKEAAALARTLEKIDPAKLGD